jgi:hypothetical protein
MNMKQPTETQVAQNQFAGTKRRSSSFDEGHHDHDAQEDANSIDSDKIVTTSKSRGIVNIQLFIRKAFAMINECDPSIASWTAEGDKFVVKNKDVFAAEVIPQYYDHNNYSSFTRQLNFYGFTREQSMTIKVTDLNSLAVGQETFYHKFFQRNRPDLLKNLQRRTTGDAKNGKKRKKPRTSADDSSAALQGRLEAMEQQTNEMLSAMQQMREENFASAAAIRDLQNIGAAKDAKIQALEKRMEWLERRMPGSTMQQQQQLRQPSQSFAPVRETSKSPWQLLDTALARQALNDTPSFTAMTSTDSNGFQNSSPAVGSLAAGAGAPGGATLAPHPRMKKFFGTSNSNNNNNNSSANNSAVVPKDIFSFENSNIQGPISRETSLDINFLSTLGREHSLMSWLPRQETENQPSS